MRKLPIILMAVLLAMIIITTITSLAAAIPDKNRLVLTRAICNEDNYCIDIKITCVGGELVKIVPIPDGVYFSGDWEDPRPEDVRNEWCESSSIP